MEGILDKKELERLCRWYEDCLKIIPEARKKALQAAADAVKAELDRQIDTRVNDAHGKVKRWQQVTMGSRGGYSKLSPEKVPVTNKYGKQYGYNSRQVTGYLDRGHAVPSPTGKNSNYAPNLRKAILGSNGRAVVPGRLFYSWTKMKASELGIAAMEKSLEQMTEDFVDLLYEKS